MRTKIKWLLQLLIAIALIVSACGRNADSSEHSVDVHQDTITISMFYLWPETSYPSQHKVVNSIIDEFEAENPHITIKQEVFDNERYKARIKVLSTTNVLPDVGMTWAAGYLQPFVEGKLFTPLDDLLHDELHHSFVTGAMDAYKVDGKTYALPLEFNIAPVFYNKEIFARYNLRAPVTYEDFLEVITTLVDHGVEPIALGNKDRWTGSLWYMYMADRLIGADMLTKAIAGEVSFEQRSLIEAAERIQDLVDMQAFNVGFNGLSDEQAKEKFINGETAMYLMGTWELPNYTTNEDIPQSIRDNIGFFKFPATDVNANHIDSWVGGPGVGLFVAENSPVKSEAKQFVQYFVKRWGEQSVTGAGVISASKVNTSKLQLPPLYIDLLNEVNKATSVTLFADVQMASPAAEVHLYQIQALFSKQITPEQFVEAHSNVIKTEQ